MISLSELTATHAQWTTARQAVIAENIANAAIPGHRARMVSDFQTVLADHLRSPGLSERPVTESFSVRASGNSVSVEQELIDAGAVNREFQLNAAITKAFHRMALSAARG